MKTAMNHCSHSTAGKSSSRGSRTVYQSSSSVIRPPLSELKHMRHSINHIRNNRLHLVSSPAFLHETTTERASEERTLIEPQQLHTNMNAAIIRQCDVVSWAITRVVTGSLYMTVQHAIVILSAPLTSHVYFIGSLRALIVLPSRSVEKVLLTIRLIVL